MINDDVLNLNEMKYNNLNYLCDEIKNLGPKFFHSQAVEGFDMDFDFFSESGHTKCWIELLTT